MVDKHKERIHGWTGQKSRCAYAGWCDCNFFCTYPRLNPKKKMIECIMDKPALIAMPDFKACQKLRRIKTGNNIKGKMIIKKKNIDKLVIREILLIKSALNLAWHEFIKKNCPKSVCKNLTKYHQWCRIQEEDRMSDLYWIQSIRKKFDVTVNMLLGNKKTKRKLK